MDVPVVASADVIVSGTPPSGLPAPALGGAFAVVAHAGRAARAARRTGNKTQEREAKDKDGSVRIKAKRCHVPP
ncbi:MAG TPA: hypothetical protein VK841_02780 [Polyangiaceae bacterium]|nr:hypothetical protein [Polyangiaceae bacterium]